MQINHPNVDKCSIHGASGVHQIGIRVSHGTTNTWASMVQDIPPLQTYAIILEYMSNMEKSSKRKYLSISHVLSFPDHIHTELVNLCLIYTYTLDHSSIALVNGLKAVTNQFHIGYVQCLKPVFLYDAERPAAPLVSPAQWPRWYRHPIERRKTPPLLADFVGVKACFECTSVTLTCSVYAYDCISMFDTYGCIRIYIYIWTYTNKYT